MYNRDARETWEPKQGEVNVVTDEEINAFVEGIREAARQSNNGVAYEWSARLKGTDRELIIASHRILSQDILASIPALKEKDTPLDQEG